MYKLSTLTLLAVILLAGCIDPCYSDQSKQDAAMEKVLEESRQLHLKEGLPLPDSGVQIISREQLHFTKKQKLRHYITNLSIAKNGYINKPSERARELLQQRHTIPLQYKKYENVIDKPEETQLRHNAENLITAYDILKVPEDKMTVNYGYAPGGTWITNKGWTGAIQLFETTFASCAYSQDNLKLSHGGVQLTEEDTRFDVNNKPTLIDIVGNQFTGFLYIVTWYNQMEVIRNQLECAQDKFSKSIEQQTIELAKAIDDGF